MGEEGQEEGDRKNEDNGEGEEGGFSQRVKLEHMTQIGFSFILYAILIDLDDSRALHLFIVLWLSYLTSILYSVCQVFGSENDWRYDERKLSLNMEKHYLSLMILFRVICMELFCMGVDLSDSRISLTLKYFESTRDDTRSHDTLWRFKLSIVLLRSGYMITNNAKEIFNMLVYLSDTNLFTTYEV